MNTVVPLPPNDGSQPAGEARSSQLTPLAAPIPTPQTSSPSLRATQASSAGDCVPPPSIPGDWPFTVNREGEIIDMRDGSIAYDLMAQLGLGIGRI